MGARTALSPGQDVKEKMMVRGSLMWFRDADAFGGSTPVDGSRMDLPGRVAMGPAAPTVRRG
jgi:hypothetical protein